MEKQRPRSRASGRQLGGEESGCNGWAPHERPHSSGDRCNRDKLPPRRLIRAILGVPQAVSRPGGPYSQRHVLPTVRAAAAFRGWLAAKEELAAVELRHRPAAITAMVASAHVR